MRLAVFIDKFFLRYKYVTAWVCLLAISAQAHPINDVSTTNFADVDKEFLQLRRAINAHDLQPVQLSFAHFLNQLDFEYPQSVGLKQPLEFELLSSRLETIRKKYAILYSEISDASEFCRQVELDELSISLMLLKERQRLFRLEGQNKPEYNGDFSKLKDAKAWYLHWIKSWLLSDVTIEELQEMAHRELADVRDKQAALMHQKQIQNTQVISRKNKNAIVAAFKAREKIVNSNLFKVINTDFIAKPVNIIESNFPKSFPAPGIYNSQAGEFIYHLQSDSFAIKQMDWLFLHEAVPGHHFQFQLSNHLNQCQAEGKVVSSSVFLEGWGAYVETLGSELGLFNDTSSLSYAYDWQALRAVRVLIDIGIHYYGWSDEQARALWMRHIPDQQEIMEREIQRIHRWPVQAISYVYGKSKIIETISRLMALSDSTDIADIRYDIVRLTNLTPRALSLWVSYQQKRMTINFDVKAKNKNINEDINDED